MRPQGAFGYLWLQQKGLKGCWCSCCWAFVNDCVCAHVAHEFSIDFFGGHPRQNCNTRPDIRWCGSGTLWIFRRCGSYRWWRRWSDLYVHNEPWRMRSSHLKWNERLLRRSFFVTCPQQCNSDLADQSKRSSIYGLVLGSRPIF